MFIDDEIVQIIVECTNQKAQIYYEDWNNKNPNKRREWQPVDSVEMYAAFGILIIAGALKANRESVHFLWTKKSLFSRTVFPASMARDRFVDILRFIRFDDLTTRTDRRKLDKLAAFRNVFEKFVVHCKKHYSPNSHLTIDEQLVAFRGKCPFRVYMKSKPAKYGIKIWALVDNDSTYALNLQVYTGKEGNKSEKDQGKRVVLDLVEGLEGGYGITTDNFFTSIPLANELLEKKLSLCGTMRKNKQDIPPVLLPHPSRAEKSSVFAFQDKYTLVSYVPAKNRAVILLSTEHHDDKITGVDRDYKPEIILHYNDTKGSVDTMDKMVNEYSVKRSTKRWPFVLFQNTIDIACLNSFVLWKTKYPQLSKNATHKRREFLLDMGQQLIKPYVERRLKSGVTFHKRILNAMYDFIGTSDPRPSTRIDNNQKSMGRCVLCPRKYDKKSRSTCDKCKNFVCSNHHLTKKAKICSNCHLLDPEHSN